MVILVTKTNIRQSLTNNIFGISFIWNQTFWLVVTDRQAGADCGVHERETARLDLYGYGEPHLSM